MQFVDLAAQYRLLKTNVDLRIQSVLDHGQFIMGPEVSELEGRLAAMVGAKHCVGVSDGSTALLIAMMSLGVGPGDEVVTTPFSFIATAEMISLLGARPVFVDIDPDTYNVDPRKIEAAISPRTKAIMPVSLYGQCADMDAVNRIADHHGLPVIEDGAQSFGASYKTRRSCALSTIGCTSFFPSKPLGCYGDGGACFTNDGQLARLMSEIRVHGQAARYRHTSVGVNGRLDTLQAAILLAKLDNFPLEVRQRTAAAERYNRLLVAADIPTVQAPFIASDNMSVFAQYTIRVENRAEVARLLGEMGVPTVVHYPVPIHQQPVYASEFSQVAMPHAERAATEVLSLPMYPTISEGDQQRVVDALKAAVTSMRVMTA